MHLSIKNKAGKYEHHMVSEGVYFYVNQLECYIKAPAKSKLLEAYSDRFDAQKPRWNNLKYLLMGCFYGVIGTIMSHFIYLGITK